MKRKRHKMKIPAMQTRKQIDIDSLGYTKRECIYEIRKETPKDETERTTYRASLSSEKIVEQWWGKEKLIHETDAIVLDRAKDGLPFLFNHNTSEPIGMIKDVRLDSEKRLTGQLIFGNSQRAREIEADVNEGLIKGVSIGYRHLKIEEDTENDVYNVTKWELYEASIAPVPADNSVGVGRKQDQSKAHAGLDETEQQPKQHIRNQPKQKAKTMDEDEIKEIQDKAREEEQRRIREITAIGDKFGKSDLAREHINKGSTIEDFRQIMLDAMPEPKPLEQEPSESNDIGMTDKEVRQFSFCRALAYLSDPNNPRMQELAAFEIECSRAAAEKSGKPTSGIAVPNKRDWFVIDKKSGKQSYPDLDGRSLNFGIPNDVLTRVLSAGTATDGQELVATDLLAGSFIDVLRNMLAVRAAGATLLTDLRGDIAIPRKTSGSTGTWITTEGGNATQSEPQFDQVTMTPKTVGVYAEITRQLLLQSSLDVEALVRRDLAAGMATTIDLAALYGTGASGQPTGISNTTGINTPTNFAGVNPTFAEVVAMETAVDVDNALMGSLSYMMRANMKGALKTTEKTATSTAQFVYESDNTTNGYPVFVSQQVTDGDLFFCNWADLLVGMWGGLDLLVDPYTNGLAGTVRLVAHQSIDLAVRHPVSFAFNNDGV